MHPIEIIENSVLLSKNSKNILMESFTPFLVKKGTIIHEDGKVMNKIGFISSGLFRSFKIDSLGSEITIDFFQRGSFFTDLESYYKQTRSEVSIESLTESSIYFLDRKTINKLYKNVPEFVEFERLYTNKISACLLSFQKKINSLNSNDSYLLFSKMYNQAIKFSPKKYIASFLGMSPFTLSRIKL